MTNLHLNQIMGLLESKSINQIRSSMNQLWIYTDQFCSSTMPAELWITIIWTPTIELWICTIQFCYGAP